MEQSTNTLMALHRDHRMRCAELMLRRPWFPGESDIDQLGKVFQALGTPTEQVRLGTLRGN